MLNFDSHKSASRSAHVVHFTAAFHSAKHLWKLPIPEYDPGNQLHVDIAQAGASAATGASDQLAALRKAPSDHRTPRVAEVAPHLQRGQGCGQPAGRRRKFNREGIVTSESPL